MSELEQCKAESEIFQEDIKRLQQTNRRLNRRCTDMEGALKEKLEKGKAEYRNFGRVLANSAAAMYRDDAEQCKAEIKVLEKLIDDWRATCVTEQTIGMEWKERALKAEAKEEEEDLGMDLRYWKDASMEWKGRAKKAEAENKELQAVFDLQETRTKKAEHLWQQSTGKCHILPDLGVLLDWLMGEVKRLKSILANAGKHF